MGKLAIISAMIGLAKEIYIDYRGEDMGSDVHRSLLTRVMNAPINRFFDITPVGKVFQRFADDIEVFRGRLLHGFSRVFGMATWVLVIIGFMTSISKWTLLFTGALAYFCFYITKPYLYADNQLHRIGHALWSPMHSFKLQALQGASVIRAFNEEDQFIAKRLEWCDKTTIHFIAHHSCWNWFNLRMYWATKFIFLCGATICITMKGSVDSILLSLVLTYTIDLNWIMHIFGTINWINRMMVQCARVHKLEEIPQESYQGTEEVDKAWPTQGEVDFKDVVLRYRENTDIVLNNLSFKVKPGEKIGIVGRTGAGKSTISAALSRIVEIEDGSIDIDGVDISKLDLQTLREQITQIPQDPVLFTGSLRHNLDPFKKETDERIEELIKRAGLEHLLTK